MQRLLNNYLMYTMYKYLWVLVCFFLFFSCSDDEPSADNPSADEPFAGCFRDDGRKIVSAINDISGTIIFNEDCGYLIDPDNQVDSNPTGVLFPCNLDTEFRLDRSRIIFSAFIYESFETEDICADFFEITEIKLLENAVGALLISRLS